MRFLLKYSIICLIIVAFFGTIDAQENPNNPTIQTSLKVRQLIEKKADYHKRTMGEQNGYRVKIHFGVDRDGARSVKSTFLGKYNDVPAYEDYQQPNFVVTVGDFKTKLEAFEFYKKIQPDFPNAFIVKSKIKPMKL